MPFCLSVSATNKKTLSDKETKKITNRPFFRCEKEDGVSQKIKSGGIP